MKARPKHRKIEARSPKGLVGITTETITEASPEPSTIEELIANWRPWARARIKDEAKIKIRDGKRIIVRTLGVLTDGAPLDCTTLAVRLLNQLWRVETYLKRGDLKSAIREALLVAGAVRAVMEVEHENAIEALSQSIEGGKREGDAKRERNRKRNVAMAGEFRRLQEHKDGRSDTALKAAIGKKRGLKPGASVNAVNDGLKYFVQHPGVLHK